MCLGKSEMRRRERRRRGGRPPRNSNALKQRGWSWRRKSRRNVRKNIARGRSRSRNTGEKQAAVLPSTLQYLQCCSYCICDRRKKMNEEDEAKEGSRNQPLIVSVAYSKLRCITGWTVSLRINDGSWVVAVSNSESQYFWKISYRITWDVIC